MGRILCPWKALSVSSSPAPAVAPRCSPAGTISLQMTLWPSELQASQFRDCIWGSSIWACRGEITVSVEGELSAARLLNFWDVERTLQLEQRSAECVGAANKPALKAPDHQHGVPDLVALV